MPLRPFEPAHSKKYDVFVNGKPLRMTFKYKVKSGNAEVEKTWTGTSHALAIHYMVTAPSQHDIDTLPRRIEEAKQMIEYWRNQARNGRTVVVSGKDPDFDYNAQAKHIAQVNIRRGLGEIALMEERLEDAKAVVAGTWEYEIYEKEQKI